MDCFNIVWNHAVKLPFLENLHEVCHSFLRTSEQGEWKLDEGKTTDRFVLHYRRGNWKKRMFGISLAPQPISAGDLPSEAPMELEIKIRPAPLEATVSLCHKLYWRDYWSHSKESRAEGERLFGKRVAEEVRGLAAYFQEVYELPETPKGVFKP